MEPAAVAEATDTTRGISTSTVLAVGLGALVAGVALGAYLQQQAAPCPCKDEHGNESASVGAERVDAGGPAAPPAFGPAMPAPVFSDLPAVVPAAGEPEPEPKPPKTTRANGRARG